MLRVLLRQSGGLITWAGSQGLVPPWAIDNARRSGRLLRVLPRVYVDASRWPNRDLRYRAALAYADGRGALSHLSALAVWGMAGQRDDEPVHLTIPANGHLRSWPGFVVHRSHLFAPEPPHAVVRGGRLVTSLERSLVDSWPLLPTEQRRAPLIRAVNDWRTTPDRVAAVLAGSPKLADRATLRGLLHRLAIGCRSALEIWGHDHVFTGPGMPDFLRQKRVRVGGMTYYLDLYAEAERVDIELDGATAHGDPAQREIDLRRDALLATVGILVVRFAHRRLVHEPTEVRRETLAILAARR